MLTTIGENSRFAAKSVDVVKETAISSATIRLGLSCTGFCAVFLVQIHDLQERSPTHSLRSKVLQILRITAAGVIAAAEEATVFALALH
jgi:hypothetical protein